jgi:hypothetical protein
LLATVANTKSKKLYWSFIELLEAKKASIKQELVIKRRLKMIDILLREMESKKEKEKEDKEKEEEEEEEEKALCPPPKKQIYGYKY